MRGLTITRNDLLQQSGVDHLAVTLSLDLSEKGLSKPADVSVVRLEELEEVDFPSDEGELSNQYQSAVSTG